ncbi:hypothetical protein [Bradyrhizobium sp. 170]|uniref:hypothetical protein n=1 Tax=Bradyrhizobium sp. 170 TaxID=2782641 RepID=UPI001FFE4B08|nr:hypothetical protein [Bradyrhizobium sp. 170]UPK03073.1 hypothetical protein IVB05_36945 [Bradyrhizobium sp. 170]
MSKGKKHRVILIDPEARLISELESTATLAALHEMIGADTLDHFRLAAFENGGVDVGWIDDGGLSRGKPIHAFLLPTAKDPIGGKCVIIGADRYGETCSCQMPVAILRQDTSWLGVILPEVTWDHTAQGSRAIVTYSRMRA